MAPSTPELLATVEALQRSKKAFYDSLCTASTVQDPLFLQKLRSENVFVLSEFLFLLRSFDLVNSPGRFAVYVHNHNGQLQDLMADPEKQRLMGLEKQRLQRGVFSEAQILKATANLESLYKGLDQADIQRLTITLFSPETCRRILETMEKAGFIDRQQTPFQSLIVSSSGYVEDQFSKYLTHVVDKLSNKVSS